MQGPVVGDVSGEMKQTENSFDGNRFCFRVC